MLNPDAVNPGPPPAPKVKCGPNEVVGANGNCRPAKQELKCPAGQRLNKKGDKCVANDATGGGGGGNNALNPALQPSKPPTAGGGGGGGNNNNSGGGGGNKNAGGDNKKGGGGGGGGGGGKNAGGGGGGGKNSDGGGGGGGGKNKCPAGQHFNSKKGKCVDDKDGSNCSQPGPPIGLGRLLSLGEKGRPRLRGRIGPQATGQATVPKRS